MHLINKPNPSRRNSRELSPEDHIESELNMDYTYMYAAAPDVRSKQRGDKRQSRIRTSFFGGGNKRGSLECSEENEGSRSQSRMTIDKDGPEGSFAFGRRKLRKASSKVSLRSMTSMTIQENPDEKSGYKSLSEILRGGRTPYAQRKASNPISNPFNFSHITHANSQDFNRLHKAPQQELVRDFNKVVRDSSLPLRRRGTSGSDELQLPSPISTGPVSDRSRSSFQTIASRRRANSTKSISPNESLCELSQVRSEESSRYACPLTPPLRTSSRHCLRSLQESPSEDGPDDDDATLVNISDDVSERTLPHAVTTPDNSSYAQQDRMELRGYKSTPDLTQIRQRSFLTVQTRPISQLSQASDTLNGSFTVPASPSQSICNRRASKRLSMLMRASGGFASDFGACLDSWEEDIDWCYENQVDADCDFLWDQNSECGSQTAIDAEEASDISMPMRDSTSLRSELLKFPEPKEQFVFGDKRITGTFEDKLLLPPSPRLPPSPGFPPFETIPMSNIGVADGGFSAYEPDNEAIIFRAADTALRHRSLSASASLPDLAPCRAYRDELNRVARKLDEHIAALNHDMAPPVTEHPAFHPFVVSHSLSTSYLRNRSRADSEATCVTLCSDTETVTPADSIEVITPSSSAHSSVNFNSQFLEGRAEKGLSFAAAALPGVVEFGPELNHVIPIEQEGLVHFI
ncbi:hypothetical protein L873DRAFT_518433 [Choiromyces venosus 120613-1]|uniref:CRIB domain-containing protein n=1 Tax=Choiromyces venosus 120613-1 TaxID=1336337 RepID=A0A3N4KAY9_9PEZI|nr:hypothetical protein L873DRAFT_518433 [Choiromyces venosus 120613-1]